MGRKTPLMLVGRPLGRKTSIIHCKDLKIALFVVVVVLVAITAKCHKLSQDNRDSFLALEDHGLKGPEDPAAF